MINFRADIKAMGAVRMTRRGKFVDKRAIAYLDYKKKIESIAKQTISKSGDGLLTGPLNVKVLFYFAPPKSYTKKKRQQILDGELLYIKKPDIDNLVKGVLDGMNNVIYKDDNQIVSVTASKHYADTDYIEVFIEETGE